MPNTISFTFADVKQWLQDLHYGDEAQKKVDFYKNVSSRMCSMNEARRLTATIRKSKNAEQQLIHIGYLDAKGNYINSTNPVLRSARKWYERNFC